MSKRKLEATREHQARDKQKGRGSYAKRRNQGRGRLIAIAAAVAIAVVVVVGAFTLMGGDDTESAAPVDFNQLTGLQTSNAPWTAGLDGLRQRLDVMGFPELQQEGVVIHIHQHLDLLIDGKKQQVPKDIGISPTYGFLTSLHTHSDDGIMHVESPTKRDFTLGEFFGVWGVKLTPDCIGKYCATGDKKVRLFVNGKAVPGNPADHVLKEHDTIVLTYGTEGQVPKPIPSDYKFPAGL